MKEKIFFEFKQLIQPLFGLTVTAFIILTPFPQINSAHPPSSWKALFEGKNPFLEIGHEYAIFKEELPPKRTISFIRDRPFSQFTAADFKKLYSAQRYLTPTVLMDTGEWLAIVDCSNSEIARRRIQEEGYHPLRFLSNGKAIAIRTTWS